MSDKKPAGTSPETISRASRQRLAQEEGARAIAELEKQSDDIRKNMQRLRALREAREAEGLDARPVLAQPVKKKRKKRIVR